MTPPTKEQARTLEAIRRLTVDGVSPSYRELQIALGYKAVSAVHKSLFSLRERGLVEFGTGRRRSLRVVDPVEAIDLTKASKEQLITLLHRTTTELVGRWKL